MATNGPATKIGAPMPDKDLEKKPMELYPMVSWKYDTLLWVMSIIADLFFREIHPRSSWKIPKHGPILFVAAPHANQVSTSFYMRCLMPGRALILETITAEMQTFFFWAGFADM